MQVEDLKDWVQVGQGVATIVAIIVAGVWAYYVFAVGRSATAHVQIECRLKWVIPTANGKILAISVVLRNTGRTRVDQLRCELTVAPIRNPQDNPAPLNYIDPLPDRAVEQGTRRKIFGRLSALEPNEEVAEDTLLFVGREVSTLENDYGTLAAQVYCSGRIFRGGVILRRSRRGDGAWVWRGVFESPTAHG